MSFYGSVSNAGKTALTFDKIYPNRKAMDANCTSDGVFVGRCVLVEYDDNTFSYLRGFINTYPSKDILYTLYLDSAQTIPMKTVASNEDGYSLAIGDLVRASHVDGSGNLISTNVYFFVCETSTNILEVFQGDWEANKTNLYYKDIQTGKFIAVQDTDEYDNTVTYYYIKDENVAQFKLVDAAESTEFVTDYDLNYNIDAKEYQSTFNFNNVNGYDSTIWQKVIEQGIIRYIMIGSLNSETPIFKVRPEAPSINPVPPHFGENSTNMTYTLHMPTVWGLRVKNVEEGLAEGEEPLSDEVVKYSFYLDSEEENEENESEEEDENSEKIKPYRGAIYYNKAGFDKIKRNVSEIKNEISVLPTGFSSKEPKYYDHNSEEIMSSKPDLQEITINLPTIGNTISEVWDVLYGEKDENGEYLNTRNDNIEWNDTSGIRMVTPDLENGGFKYSENKTESVAGAINSVHDLMGMIIDTAPAEGETRGEALNRAATNKIYFGALKEDEVKKGFYFKDSKYRLVSFEEMSSANSLAESAGQPKPYPDFIDKESYVGSRVYYDLTQFNPGVYYTYSNNNFYLDMNDIPTTDSNYYLLGEPKKVLLKQWQDEIEDPETGELYTDYVYYKNDTNDFIKDTSEEPDETKIYYALNLTQMTKNKDEDNLNIIPVKIWNPQNPELIPNEGETAWNNFINLEDINISDLKVYKNGYFYKILDAEGKDDNLILLCSSEKDENGNFIGDIKESFDSSKTYYKIAQFAILKTQDSITGEISEVAHFISPAGTLVPIQDVVDGSNIGSGVDYNQYRMNFIPFVENLYYYEYILEDEEENIIEEGYKLLTSSNEVDDETIYYTIETKITAGEGATEEETDIYFTHYYKPNIYYFKNASNDYILSTSKTFNNNQTYYLLTDKNNNLLEKNNITGLFIIEPENLTFYEPDIYYYYSIQFNKNLLDTSDTMKTPDDPDVHKDYIKTEVFEDGTTKDLVYFIPQEAYVVSDSSGILSPGMLWNKNVDPPEGVVLGARVSISTWTELKGFSQDQNTINGLILHLNKFFKFNDKINRDTKTVQGSLNQLNDMIDLTEGLNPGKVVAVDDYGRMTGFTLKGDGEFINEDYGGWILPEIDIKNSTITLIHNLPENTEIITPEGQTSSGNLKFGESFSALTFSIDKNGHVRSETFGQAAVKLPDLAIDNTATGNIMTGLAVSADGQTIVVNKTNLGGLTVTSGNTLDSIDEKVTVLSSDSTTPGSVAYQIAQVLNDADPTDIDTLEEIASWIINDTTGAAKMAADIAANSAAIAAMEGSVSADKIAQWDAAEANVQVDWNVTDTTSDAFILNKPDLSTYITNTQEFVYDYNGTQTNMTIQALLTYIAGLEARIKTLEDAAAAPTT